MKRIIVIGTTGSGKSTLSAQLSEILKFPHYQLDALQFKSNWEIVSDDIFFAKIKKATDQDSWIIDGNFGRTHHLTWPYADTVIWIDLPFLLTLYQNISRTLKRIITREEIWEGTGNRESWKLLFSKDSIVRWLFKTYHSNISRYEKRMKDTNYAHLCFIRLRSRREIEDFILKISKDKKCY